jgi:transcriptional regulator
MVKGIVGLEIRITRLVGKAKLSQNREERDVRLAAQMLKAEGHPLLGDAMLTRAALRPRK